MTENRVLGVARTSLLAIALGFALGANAVHAQEPPEFKIIGYSFPSTANIIFDVMKVKGFDAKNGVKLSNVIYGQVPTSHASFSTNEVQGTAFGVYQMPNMRASGVPVVMGWTLIRLSSLQIVARDASVKEWRDLKGKTLAADRAVTEFQILRIYSSKLGLDLGNDVNVVNANLGAARASLAAERVEAAMIWEPTATAAVKDNPAHRSIINGSDMWRTIAGAEDARAWQLGIALRQDFLDLHPGIAVKIFRMYRDGAEFIQANPDEADEIITSGRYSTKGLTRGALRDAVQAGRLVFEVLPTWEPSVNKDIWRMLQIGYEQKLFEQMLAKEAIMATEPK